MHLELLSLLVNNIVYRQTILLLQHLLGLHDLVIILIKFSPCERCLLLHYPGGDSDVLLVYPHGLLFIICEIEAAFSFSGRSSIEVDLLQSLLIVIVRALCVYFINFVL